MSAPLLKRLQRLEQARAQANRAIEGGFLLEDAALPWQEWLEKRFSHVCTAPFAERHIRLWTWFDALTSGVRPRPLVEIWPRGGAKSSSVELGCAWCCVRLSRRYVLYVSETQEQADKHVQALATLLEREGVERALSIYGTSKGWRRQELRTANGFNASAYGLDTAARGVKLDQFRPDLIILDDIDRQDDSPRTVEKKIDAITTAILPAGSADAAVLFVQNLVHEDSIAAQLCDGRADFLHDREEAHVEPAVIGLVTQVVEEEDGRKEYRITSGRPTWEGQDLTTCEQDINRFGLRAFLRECQHEVQGAAGYFFDVSKLNVCDVASLPALTGSGNDTPLFLRICRAWDLAATEGAGDWTAGVKLARAKNGRIFVLDVVRGQWEANKVRETIERTAASDEAGTLLRLPQDPGQAGKAQSLQFSGRLRAYRPTILPVTGRKATRAAGFAEEVNKGNVWLVRAHWNAAFREELRRFSEDEPPGQVDDQADSAGDAYNEIVGRRKLKVYTWD